MEEMPPETVKETSGKAACSFTYKADEGPVSIPSRAMSVTMHSRSLRGRNLFQPAFYGDAPVPDVGPENDPCAEPLQPGLEQLRLQSGHAACDGVCGSGRKNAIQRRCTADSAAPFQLAGNGAGNGFQDLQVGRSAGFGSVQIDQVDALHSGVGIAAGHLRRHAVVGFLAAVISLG